MKPALGDGHEGIQAVFEERNREGGDMSFMAFDLLTLDGQNVMWEPWKDRRQRLEDLFIRQVIWTKAAQALEETTAEGRGQHE